MNRELLDIVACGRDIFRIVQPLEEDKVTILDRGKVYEHIVSVLQTPLMQQMLLVGQCAKNLRLRKAQSEGQKNTFLQPAYFLIDNEYMPLKGLRLVTSNEESFLPELWYVGLGTSDSELEVHGVERIMSHEYGHVIMYNLIDYEQIMAANHSNIHHLTTSISDYAIAFAEGWGDHFEAMAVDFTETQYLQRWNRGLVKSRIHGFWQSNHESRQRQWGVRENVFVHETALDSDFASLTVDKALKYLMTNTAYTYHKLKTSEDMLACEGVVASIFYRLVNDELVQSTCASPKVYQDMLPEANTHQVKEFAEGITPLVNAYLKVIYTFYGMSEHLSSKEPFIVTFFKTYGALFPQERENVYSLFLETTNYVTANKQAAELYKRLKFTGITGDIPGLKRLWGEWQELEQSTVNEVLRTDDLAPLLKSEEWVEIADIRVNKALWLEGKEPLRVNKNSMMFKRICEKLQTLCSSHYRHVQRV